MPIDSVIPNPSNPRKHPRQQLRDIARSIEKFGFTAPIGVDRKNKIVFGHGRWEAARLRGLKEVPMPLVVCNGTCRSKKTVMERLQPASENAVTGVRRRIAFKSVGRER